MALDGRSQCPTLFSRTWQWTKRNVHSKHGHGEKVEGVASVRAAYSFDQPHLKRRALHLQRQALSHLAGTVESHSSLTLTLICQVPRSTELHVTRSYADMGAACGKDACATPAKHKIAVLDTTPKSLPTVEASTAANNSVKTSKREVEPDSVTCAHSTIA